MSHAPVLHELTKRWWLLLLRGVAAIAFGILAFIWPGVTLITLVIFYGAFALIDGILAPAAAFTPLEEPQPTRHLCGIINLLVEAQDIVG